LDTLDGNDTLYGFDARTSLSLFFMVASLTMVLFYFFLRLEYRSNLAILDLCCAYQNRGSADAISLASQLPN